MQKIKRKKRQKSIGNFTQFLLPLEIKISLNFSIVKHVLKQGNYFLVRWILSTLFFSWILFAVECEQHLEDISICNAPLLVLDIFWWKIKYWMRNIFFFFIFHFTLHDREKNNTTTWININKIELFNRV